MRSRLWAEALATVLFFVAGIASPRAGFVSHSHGGGEHGHVHLDGGATDRATAEIDRLLEDALGREAHHHHPPHLPGTAGIETPDTSVSWHWHALSPFHRAINASAFTLAVQSFTAEAPEFARLSPPATVAGSSQARAPPFRA